MNNNEANHIQNHQPETEIKDEKLIGIFTLLIALNQRTNQ